MRVGGAVGGDGERKRSIHVTRSGVEKGCWKWKGVTKAGAELDQSKKRALTENKNSN